MSACPRTCSACAASRASAVASRAFGRPALPFRALGRLSLFLVLLGLLLPLGAEAGASSFDPESFFSASPTTGAEQSPPRLPGSLGGSGTGLVIDGEASFAAVYSMVDPFDEESAVPASSSYAGLTATRLDAVGGDRDAAKLDLSLVAGYAYAEGADPSLFLQVKKLYLSVFTRYADLFVGRMVVNYGRGTVFSPADLFSGVDTSDLELGRTGTDALRVLLPFGPVSGLDLVSTISTAPEEATAGFRGYGNIAGWDLGAAAFYDGSEEKTAILSLDLKGDLLLGISAEAVAFIPLAEPAEALGEAMLGLDYSLGGEWFFDLEYQWNGSEGERGAFRGEHSLFGSLSWQIDELSALDLRAIADLSDGTWLGTLSLARDIARGAELLLYGSYRAGDVERTPTSAASYAASGEAPVAAIGLRLIVSF